MERDSRTFYRDGMQPLRLLPSPFRLRPQTPVIRVWPAPACVPPGPEPEAITLPTDGRSIALRFRRPVRLRVFGGRAWITRDGWPDDHWLAPGHTLELPASAGWFGYRIFASGEGASFVTLKAETID
jgi:hypothetical protein